MTERMQKCTGGCQQDVRWSECDGRGWCHACAGRKEAAWRAESGIQNDFGPEANEAIDKAIASFPETFGLRGFPGDTFKIDRRDSFVSQGRILLYTHKLMSDDSLLSKEAGKRVWSAFSKGSIEELRREVVNVRPARL